jgi:hypothetical protein
VRALSLFRHRGQPQSTRDWCGFDGAAALAKKINEYWRERGYEVYAQRVTDSAVFGVRSMLVNGCPRKSAALPSQQSEAA